MGVITPSSQATLHRDVRKDQPLLTPCVSGAHSPCELDPRGRWTDGGGALKKPSKTQGKIFCKMYFQHIHTSGFFFVKGFVYRFRT